MRTFRTCADAAIADAAFASTRSIHIVATQRASRIRSFIGQDLADTKTGLSLQSRSTIQTLDGAVLGGSNSNGCCSKLLSGFDPNSITDMRIFCARKGELSR